jgi:hypothetical protein
MLFFNSPTLLLASNLASALAQTSYGSNNDTKPGSNDSLANAPYSTCRFLTFVLNCTATTMKVPFIFNSILCFVFNKRQAQQDRSTGRQ